MRSASDPEVRDPGLPLRADGGEGGAEGAGGPAQGASGPSTRSDMRRRFRGNMMSPDTAIFGPGTPPTVKIGRFLNIISPHLRTAIPPVTVKI